MHKAEAEERIAHLNRELNRHDHLYYVEATPEISDREYDDLFDELKDLEKRYPDLLLPDSATQRVGSDLDNSLPEVEHTIPVLSLDKAYTGEEIRAWLERVEKRTGALPAISIEEKIDGSSIVLYYEAGQLVRAVTRGNGRVGNDVTANVKTIRSVPLSLTRAVSLVVRGEIFIPQKAFDRYNKEAGGVYANPRNLAAGILRSVKSSSAARVPLEIFIYDGFMGNGPWSHQEMLKELRQLGFRMNPNIAFFFPESVIGNSRTLDDIGAYLKGYTARREKLDYEIDGLVLKVDRNEIREQLGYTAHHPRWAIAYKFEPPQVQTRLLSITLQIGRNGRATPVAELEPVALAGSVISRATLHNLDYIREVDLSCGDRVSVSKRGDVIPSVDSVIRKGQGALWNMPEVCPVCSTALVKEGAHHYCPNRSCPARKIGRLLHFCGKQGLDIDGLGEKTVRFLFSRFELHKPEDLFSFDYTQLVEEEGFGEKKVEQIIRGLEAAKKRSLVSLLSAAGIEGLGRRSAESLVQGGFNTLELILEAASRGDWQSFAEVEGFAELLARQMVAEFSLPENIRMFEELTQWGLTVKAEAADSMNTDGPFTGEVWCVTGSFEKFRPRELAREIIRKGGGRTVETVSGKTTHLLAGEQAGGKLNQAEKRGIQIVDEQEFLRLMRG